MIKKITVAIGLLSLIIFSGCSKRQIVIPQKTGADIVSSASDNTWINEASEENVDISDIENNITMNESSPIEQNQENRRMERITFPVSEYANLTRIGKGTVKGTIYLNDAYGRAIVGKNTRLYLNPITSYSKQWYNESYLGGYKMQKADSRLFNYLKFTASDNEGRFAFYGVPSGQYYLIGTVKCGSECGYAVPKSVRIATQVSVTGNQVITKNLTRLVE